MARADRPTIYSQLRRMLCAGALAGTADEDLLAQFIARRDEAAFATLLCRHGPMVWGVCRRLLTCAEDAEDAFQATFLLLARKAASIQRRELLANWLFGVARRLALAVRGKAARRARRERCFGQLPDVSDAPAPPWQDVRAVVDEELARMPDKYRLPMLLCALEGMTHVEAGKSLGWPTGTVAVRLFRGRQLLRSRLLRRGVSVPATALAAVLAATLPPRAAAAAACRAALAAGTSAAGVAPAVALLVRRGLRAMALWRGLTAAALLTALGLTLAGAGLAWHLTRKATAPGPDGELARRPCPSEAPFRPTVPLPADPDAVVLRMERLVGPATKAQAAVTVHADGRVVVEVPDGLYSLASQDLTRHAQAAAVARLPGTGPAPVWSTTVLRGKLSPRELDGLMRFAVREQEFFDFDPPAVQAAIRRGYNFNGDLPDPGDDTTTRFRVRTADRTHEVQWARLDRAAWSFPEVRRLLQLHAVDRRLQQVYYVLLAGGPERVAAVAAVMDQVAQPWYRRYPGAPRLTAADLFRVAPFEDGSGARFTFSHNDPDGTVRNPLFEIAIDVPRHGKPRLGYVTIPRR